MPLTNSVDGNDERLEYKEPPIFGLDNEEDFDEDGNEPEDDEDEFDDYYDIHDVDE